MSVLTKQVGERIRYFRKLKGWTQDQLAENADLHYSYIGGIERGVRNISLETIDKIINALEVEPTELFTFQAKLTSAQMARRRAIDEHITMITNRSTEEIKRITKINRDILDAIDNNHK